MFQRTFPNNWRPFRLFIPIFLISCLTFQVLSPVSAQTSSQAPQADKLDVNIHKVSINPNTIYKDLPANFPFPVMSVMTVKDENNRYVHGLADTSRWLGNDDRNQNGNRISKVWRTLSEYHQENHNIPSDRDIKHTAPPFLIRELSNVDGLGVSMALVMDWSGSMDNDIYFAEDAAKVLMNNMNSSDQMAIVKVTDNIYIFQTFTSDTSLLRQAIERPTGDRSGTAIYKGIYETISLCIGISGRKAVIVYTDGKENYFHYSLDEIINHANANDVTLFTIGLGGGVDEASLRKMAYWTGGFFMTAKKATELKKIYMEIYSQIKGHYVLAHTSTDPFTNGTWREVHVTIENQGVVGKGVGRYYVPYLLPNLTIKKSAFCDSTQILNGDTLRYAEAGDTISYVLTILNEGKGTAGDVEIVDVLGDSVSYADFSLTPTSLSTDSVVWKIPRIDPGATLQISYNAIVRPRLSSEMVDAINECRIYCDNDSILTDNNDQAVVYVYGVPDLTIRCLEPERLLSPGYPQKLRAYIKNQGSADISQTFRIGYYVESIESEPIGVDTCYALFSGDSTLSAGIWTPQAAGLYRIRAFVDMDNAIIESNEENNFDSCIIEVGIDDLTAVVSDISLSDSILGVQAAFPKPVLNMVNVIDQNFFPIHSLANTNQWITTSDQTQLGKSAGEIWQRLEEFHRENESIPEDADVRPTMQIREETASDVNLVLITDLSSAMAPFSSVTQSGLSGLIETNGFSDWGAVVGFNNTIQTLQDFTQDEELIEDALDAACSGNQRRLYDALDSSLDLAFEKGNRNAVVCATYGEDVGSSATQQEIVQEAQEKGVPIYFIDFNETSMSNTLKFLSDATGGFYLNQSQFFDSDEAFTVIDGMLRNYYVISHTSSDTVQNQTWRVVDVTVSAHDLTTSDQGFYQSLLGILDVAVTKNATTITFGSSNYPEGYVHPSDSILYSVTLRNIGHHLAKQISIQDILAENLIPITYTMIPEKIQGDTLQWTIDSLQIGESIEIQYTCFVDTLRISDIIPIPNSVTIQCAGDTTIENNFAADTILYVPLISGDVAVTKQAVGDSLFNVNNNSAWYVFPGGIVHYQVALINIGEMDCRDIVMTDILPEDVTLQEFFGGNYTLEGNTLQWTHSLLAARGGMTQYLYSCKVDTFMPTWEVSLINRITSQCVEDTIQSNNTDSDTVWVAVPFPPDPQIRISPSVVEPGDSVMVEVLSPVQIQDWNMTVIYADGSTNHSYWDSFIASNHLVPQEWTLLQPDFDDTRMRINEKEERAAVIFETTDLWNITRSDTGYFDIRSGNSFFLDHNVFRINDHPTLGMRFKLSSNRRARIVVYDIAGTYIKTVTDNTHIAGWNQVAWDGRNYDGNFIGNGVYVVVLTSGNFKQVHKFILVR